MHAQMTQRFDVLMTHYPFNIYPLQLLHSNFRIQSIYFSELLPFSFDNMSWYLRKHFFNQPCFMILFLKVEATGDLF